MALNSINNIYACIKCTYYYYIYIYIYIYILVIELQYSPKTAITHKQYPDTLAAGTEKDWSSMNRLQLVKDMIFRS